MATASHFSRSLSCWRLIAAPQEPLPEAALAALPDWSVRLADFLGPALAAALTEPAAQALGAPPIDPATAERSRQLNRYARAAQEACLARIAEAGIACVAIKGFALARQIYGDPDLRTTGDLDLVVRAGERNALLDLLSREGFAFRPEPAKPWGFIADASYAPFVSADGGVTLDIHVQPDSYPLHLGLDCETLFAAARQGPNCLLPAPSHSFLLLASNAAKDKFAPLAVKKFVDALIQLRSGEELDWEEIFVRAGRARLTGPLAVFLRLLSRLGGTVPEGYRAHETQGREFARALRPLAALDSRAQLGPAALIRREVLLSAEPRVAARNLWLRARGLLRPRGALPPGWTVS
ncbi:MAG: nucleotidyltransferase family protein [Rhodovibrionaceae bacterium]